MVSQPTDILKGSPRLPLALLPTPLQELARLQTLLGQGCPRLLIKRDDLTGLALGGNKARKLEYLLADARSKGADTVITCGAAQSNHALLTAVACRELGFDVRCVLYGAPTAMDSTRTGNLLLHALLDTPIRWVRMEAGEARREQALRRGIADEARSAELEGKKPYCIPTGGSTAVGALGYVRAVQELHSQLGPGEADQVRALYFASGSGGTHAGMVAGARLLNWALSCVGVEIDPIPLGSDGTSPFQRAIFGIAKDTADLLRLNTALNLADIELDAGFTGPVYGAETPEGRDAARLLFRTEGILLDPVYTAKAFAALLAAVKQDRYNATDTILFWHTGGAPGFFAAH